MLMEIIALAIALTSLPCARADGWDDFTNNLATDLAPLLALFGEQVTKQFLSESLSLWDNFIFAMAPLGILTAVVSVVRVLGSNSLKAFIGRAQEPPGSAELELLSSTSETTAELWNDGGIARVFGKPKMLEVASSPQAMDGEGYFKHDARSTPPTSGLYPFGEAVSMGIWVEASGRPLHRTNVGEPPSPRYLESGNHHFRHPPALVRKPNLSLNVGIQPRHKGYTIGAAVVGFLLQGGVLIFSGLATYYFPSSHFEKNGKPMSPWAFPLVFSGTCLLCLGMFTCAFFIERCTSEVYYEKPRQHIGAKIYWVQPGGQKVGDQVFDACVLMGDRATYISSFKNDNSYQDISVTRLSAAVSTTILGFVLQFVGLRAMHSSIAMAQLGATGIMAIIRASLRTQRTRRDQNLLEEVKAKVHGHELDWLAMKLEDAENWEVAKPSAAANGCLSNGKRYVGFWETGESADEIYSTFEQKGSEAVRVSSLEKEDAVHPASGTSMYMPNQAARIMRSRARLAQIIKSGDDVSWETKIESKAILLRKTIEEVMNVLFASGTTLRDGWGKASRFYWAIDCKCANMPLPVPVYFSLRRAGVSPDSPSASWVADILDIEAALGLWVWSMRSRDLDRLRPKYNRLIARVEKSGVEAAQMEYRMWIQRSLECETADHPSLDLLSFFGWPGFGEEDESATLVYVPRDPSSEMASLIRVESISVMCAQDIFITFFAAVMEIVEDIGGTTGPRENNPTMEIGLEQSALESSWDGSFLLLNSQLKKIAEIFARNGLGSIEDAYMCIIPTLSKASKLPSLESAHESAELAAGVLQGRGQLSKAADLLKWVRDSCGICAQPEGPAAQARYSAAETKVGELYRIAMRKAITALRSTPNRTQPTADITSSGPNHQVNLEDASSELNYRIGLEGIIAMFSVCTPPSEISKRYGWIALQMEDEVQAGGQTWSSEEMVRRLRRWEGVIKGYGDSNNCDLLYWVKEFCREKRGETPKTHEDRLDALTVVRLLLGRDGVDVNMKGEAQDGGLENKDRTPLSWAAQNGDPVLVRLLLDQPDLKPNIADRGGMTPLSYAAQAGHGEVLKLLIECETSLSNVAESNGQTPLMLAAKNGHEDVVSILINKSVATLNTQDRERKTPLMLAIEQGHGAVAKLLVEKGADVEAKDARNRTPLSLVAQNGDEVVASLLIEYGAGPKAKDLNLRTPLSFAAENGHEAVAGLLVEKGADLDALELYDMVPLSWAAKNGHLAVATLLVEMGAAIDPVVNPDNKPLILAASNGHEAIVNLLSMKGADIETKDAGARAPLSLAAEKGHQAIVSLLALKGANIESKDHGGLTPISFAAMCGHESIVRLLLEKGANIEAKGRRGFTPLLLAAQDGREAVVRLLIERGANIRVEGGNGWTPLSAAAERGHDAVVSLLIEKGADIEARNMGGMRPLSWAAKNGCKGSASLLIKSGAHIEAKDANDMTPLLWAARGGHTGALSLLIRKGGDIKAKDTDGMTPPLWASRAGHEGSLSALIKKGADIGTKGANGMTPLLWAARERQGEVLGLLIQNGADIEAKDANGMTPLLWAAREAHIGVLNLLIENGADIWAKDKFGKSALAWAQEKSHLRAASVLKSLMEDGPQLVNPAPVSPI